MRKISGVAIQECSGITLYDEEKLYRDEAEAMRAFAPQADNRALEL